jgi:hypothetical protein
MCWLGPGRTHIDGSSPMLFSRGMIDAAGFSSIANFTRTGMSAYWHVGVIGSSQAGPP